MSVSENLISDLLKRSFEDTWFEFKANWFDPDGIGEYISALSNAAVIAGADFGYLIWGVDDVTHEATGTDMDFTRNVRNEPLEHYLTRNLYPALSFRFESVDYRGKRLVVLTVPAARSLPTSYKNIRYTRIGTSKESLLRYPEREAELWNALNHVNDTIENTESAYQDLTFGSLVNYYSTKGITLDPGTFRENLGLLTRNGRYNILAQLLSDNSRVCVRIAVFAGKEKSDPLFAVKECGFMSLLLSLDKVLDYGDTFNIPQADERNRKAERKEVMLFDSASYREAIINAFVHNDWMGQNAPMITFFSDRIEIISNGALSPKLTMDDFYRGKSKPVNKSLSDIFLQLHLSERSGRGVPTIVKRYGKRAFSFLENYIMVTIPFNFLHAVDYRPGADQVGEESPEYCRRRITPNQNEIMRQIRSNPGITIGEIASAVGLSPTAVFNNLNRLQEFGLLERDGSRKTGYWRLLES